MDILFLAKRKPFVEDSIKLVKQHFPDARIVIGRVEDRFPAELMEKKYDYVISYISPWIVPTQVLENSKVAAINFHPGPPQYPGIGCTNFAMYNGENTFGITVHHMKAKVDTGDIIMVKRFPLFPNDTLYCLTTRCYAYIYTAFIELFGSILNDRPLPKSDEKWTTIPYTRKQLDELCRITGDMSDDEITRRVRATSYPNMPGSYIELGGIRFLAQLKSSD